MVTPLSLALRLLDAIMLAAQHYEDCDECKGGVAWECSYPTTIEPSVWAAAVEVATAIEVEEEPE